MSFALIFFIFFDLNQMYWWQLVRTNDPRVLEYIDRCIDLRDHRDRSNLHVAAEAGHYRLVEAFLRVGVNVNDSFPETPLLYAARHSNCQIISVLLRSGARIPTAWNVMQFCPSVRRLLLEHRCGLKWLRWTRRRRRTRERQWTRIVWRRKQLSCDLSSLLDFFAVESI